MVCAFRCAYHLFVMICSFVFFYSEIAQHATELAESVIGLTDLAKENASTEKFDDAMEQLVKKYTDFEQIITKT